MSTQRIDIPGELYARLQAQAEAAGRAVDDLFVEAAQQWLANREVDDLAEYGQSHARRLGLQLSDSVRAVREVRNESMRGR